MYVWFRLILELAVNIYMHGCKLVIQYTIYSWLINQFRFFASYLWSLSSTRTLWCSKEEDGDWRGRKSELIVFIRQSYGATPADILYLAGLHLRSWPWTTYDSLVLNLLMLVQFLSHLGYTVFMVDHLIWFTYTCFKRSNELTNET